ncbi:TonB-dependent receptor [Kineobactrum salinum]|uniref:TonB-dependent receptor n=1 Tax=Kineobactrum salinum TaxID=2708301 RepID=A0A6C0U483_9GAMM|nr:TonB-dependent receptor [Kineobactrum salinum]QIB66653.1 TonB-dependent receptor [Kineobactrum salinum]
MKLFSCLLPPALLLACQTHADNTALEEIIVTAELRDITLQQQPVSTSVLTGDMIRERAAQHLEQVFNVIPNLNYAGGTSRARFFQIRGIGERSQFQEPLNPSIGLLLDGVDFSGLGTVGTLFDVEQVEVLRGPQGTLHGANALAGLVNIRSAAPEATPGLEIQGSVADYDSWSLGVVGTGPLVSDTLLYRIAVQQHRSDGYIKNDFLGRDDTSDRDETTVRGRLRWLASGTDSVDLTLLYADIDNGYDVFSLDNNRRTLSDQPGKDRQESTALSLHWQGQRDSVDFETLLTAATTDSDYSYDEDWAYVGIAPELEYSSFDRFLRDRDSFSAQLRLLSNDQSHLFGGRGQWVAGLYYLADREQLQRQYTYLAEDFFSDYDADTAAVFGQLDTALSEQLTLISGLRLERRETDYSDSNSIAGDTARTLWGARLVLEFQYREDAMLYGGVSRGYRGSGVNTNILSGLQTTDNPELLQLFSGLQSFDEETLLNYELGHKGSTCRAACARAWPCSTWIAMTSR